MPNTTTPNNCLMMKGSKPFCVTLSKDYLEDFEEGEKPSLEYSHDQKCWKAWDLSPIPANKNNTLFLRGKGNIIIEGSFEFCCEFDDIMELEDLLVECYGSIMTLLDWENPDKAEMGEGAFAYLFDGCPITVAPELPALNLAIGCYAGLFYDCDQLKTAPELPATTLKEGCYMAMFQGCKSLTEAPELPATTLEKRCYENMFNRCKAFTKLPQLPATTLANNCYHMMFAGCMSLTEKPKIKLTKKYHNDMFIGCAKLEGISESKAYAELISNCMNQLCNDYGIRH